MSNKIETVLRIVAIVSLIVGAWALALNQLSAFIENGQEAKLVAAAGECVRFDAPHAIMSASGEIFCYGVYNGSERLAPLSYLLELFGEASPEEQAGKQ